MKKLCLAAITSLLLPNMSYAAACADGANADGCTISTSDITYTLTGNITPASGVVGIKFNTDADRNDVTQTGNITTTGDVHRAVSLTVTATPPTSPVISRPQGIAYGLFSRQ